MVGVVSEEVLTTHIQQAETAERRIYWVAAAGTCFVTLLYLLLFSTHFLGLRSGMGEYLGGTQFLAGRLPYRDYFSTAMPLNVLKSAGELSLFGNLPIVSRVCGIAERILITSLLFVWLAKSFRPQHAALAVIVTMIVSSGDTSDPISSYNHDAILFAMLCGFFASFVLSQDLLRRTVLFATLAGVCAGLSFATKQTVGPVVTVAVPIVMCAYLMRSGERQKAGMFLLSYCLGWALIAAALLFWLQHLGILSPFLQQVFVQGPAAKASHPSDFFVRFAVVAWQMKWAVLGATLCVALCFKAWVQAGFATEHQMLPNGNTLVTVGCAFLALVFGASLSYIGWMQNPRHAYLRMVIYAGFFGVAGMFAYWSSLCAWKGLTVRQAQLFLLTTVSLVVASTLSLSYPIFEAMLLPGLGLLVASVLHVSNGWRHMVVFAACLALIANGTLTKLELPFSFNTFSEARVPTAHTLSKLPQLHGFVLPADTVALVDGTVKTIQANTHEGDTIFTYPEMVVFYALSGLNCPTQSCSHNIDVVSDSLARREATRLLAHPPKVLIYQPQPEAFLASEERLWRHGKPSGNRDIIRAVETLAKHYDLAGCYHVAPNDDPVSVYVRRP